MLTRSPRSESAMMLCDPADFDIEEKGWLTRHEVKCYLSCALGFRPRANELGNLMSEEGRCEFADAEATVQRCAPNEEDYLKEIFQAMDIEQRGYLTVESVLTVFELSCPTIKPEVVRTTFRELDLAKTGMISYQQFRWIMGASVQRRRMLNGTPTFFPASMIGGGSPPVLRKSFGSP